MAALCTRGPLYFCPVVSFFYLLLLLFSSPKLSATDWMSTILLHMAWPYSANLECRSEMCCTRLAANTGRKSRQKSPSGHHHTTSSGYIFANKACIDNRKKLVKQQYLLNMFLQYGELRPTNGWDLLVSLGHAANFNGFRVLAALLHGTLVVGVSQTAALNRGRHLYSAGQPSRWALAHILVDYIGW